MKRPGEQASLYYDSPRPVEAGDYIRTASSRTYLVTSARIQLRGKHAGRQHLTTIVMPPDHVVEDGATVHALHWYRRDRRTS